MLFWSPKFMGLALLWGTAYGLSLNSTLNTQNERQLDTYLSSNERYVKMCINRDGDYADPKDCTRHIVCTNGVPDVQLCDVGEVFIPNVGCEPSGWPNCKVAEFYCNDKKEGIFGRDESEFQQFDPTKVGPGNIDGISGILDKTPQDEESLQSAYALFLNANLVPSTTFTCPADKGYFPIRNTNTVCQTFNICIKGQAYDGTCQGSLNFDVVTGKCLPSGIAHCVAAAAPVCANNGVFQQTGFCDRYVVCCNQAMTATTYYCKPGESFDTNSYKCTLTAKATCTP